MTTKGKKKEEEVAKQKQEEKRCSRKKRIDGESGVISLFKMRNGLERHKGRGNWGGGWVEKKGKV